MLWFDVHFVLNCNSNSDSAKWMVKFCCTSTPLLSTTHKVDTGVLSWLLGINILHFYWGLWTTCVCVCVYVRERERERERLFSPSPDYIKWSSIFLILCDLQNGNTFTASSVQTDTTLSRLYYANRYNTPGCYFLPQQQVIM